MNLHWIDWTIVLAMLTFIVIVAVSTKKHTQSVADSLAANRCAGRYLLCVAGGIAGMGAISIVAKFEMFYRVGFTAQWWLMMMIPVQLMIFLLGVALFFVFLGGQIVVMVTDFFQGMFTNVVLLVIMGTIWNLRVDLSVDAWAKFWWWKVVVTVVIGIGTTVWFLVGGLRDLKDLYKTLRTVKRDHLDSGMVVGHHNLGEEPEDRLIAEGMAQK